MRLITVQDKAAYDDLCRKGVLRCNPELAEWLREDDFQRSYDWLAEQMRQRVGEPPRGVTYPIWAWYRLDGKPAKLDLRKAIFNNCRGEQYALTIEIPDEQVLLSDEENWHLVLNDSFIGDADNETDYDKAIAWFDGLPTYEQQQLKTKSWEKIFDTTPSKNEWCGNGSFVQATFWELRKEQLISSRRFIGKNKKYK
jgi:hypothetical protein